MDDEDDDCLLLVVDMDAGYSQLVDGDGNDVELDVLDAKDMLEFGIAQAVKMRYRSIVRGR